MGASEQAAARSGIRVEVQGSGVATVDTGLPVLDRLLERLAEYARFDLALEVEPRGAEAEVAEAGTAHGGALARPLRASGARGYGVGVMTSSFPRWGRSPPLRQRSIKERKRAANLSGSARWTRCPRWCG